jgi:RND superfamily putative drug exporter
MSPRTAVQLFRAVAVAEALTWIGLLIGMYVKYVPETTELGVRVFGPIHGGVFVLYVVVTLLTARRLRWSPGTALLALAASVPPFATVVFEEWARRSGRLEAVRAA